ncbi:MAG: chorismate lyase [Moraxella sp.]|nr:chorismate lyase [Moraxella sp.]
MTPPDTLLPFLTAQGSLTALLEQKAGQPLCVKVICEGYQPIDFYHKKLLNLPLHRPTLAWVREVLLFGNETKAWVRAKSIFPVGSLSGNAKRLRHLKNTPIGYVMFKKNRQLPLSRRQYFDGEHFGRQTIYQWQGKNLLVQETFLLEFERFLSQHQT